MNYTLEIVALIVIVLLLVYSQRLLQFLNLTDLKFKISNPAIVNPNEIEQNILIELAKIEKFLYKERFTRRIIVRDCTSIKKANAICYKFYYYQLIDGIHAYVETTASSSKKIEFNIHFETQYDSKKVAVTTDKNHYLLGAVPENIYLFKHNNLTLEGLYRVHFNDREIFNETVYKKRFNENDLIYQAQTREKEQIEELANSGYIKYTNYGFKLLRTFKLFRNTQESYNLLGATKSKKKIIMLLVSLYIAIALIFAMVFFFTKKQDNVVKTPKILDTKSELMEFKKQVESYKGLTIALSSKNPYTLQESMADLDNYLKNSKIKRFIGKPLTKPIEQKLLPCKLPSDLEAVYKWHNGIELLVPNRDLFRYEDTQKSYSAFKDRLAKNNNSNLVFVFASKYEYRGLAFSCNKSGIYEYAIGAKGAARKEFYSMNHFLKITAEAYKQKAFYDTFDTIQIDLKKFFKIYRSYLSNGDIHRYKSLIRYIHQKSNDYTNAPKELKIELLNEIAKTYDPALTKSAKQYLNDNNKEVVSKAIYALGNVGSKSSLPTLIKLLKSKSMQYRDFALLSIAKIVDSKDEGLLEYIYPMLKDKSILVRLSAYKVIEKVGSINSLIILRKYFNNEKPAVKLAIVKIFAKIGGDKEFKLLQNYLKEVNKMGFSGKIREVARGADPHPKILQFEIVRAVTQIISRDSKK